MTHTAPPVDTVPAAPYREPLDALARFAFDWAGRLCDPANGCASYHRMWTLVRLLETGGALPAGVPFFDRELPKLARDGQIRVVLSGCADTGLMTLAANAVAQAGLVPQITAIDRCATPLKQCRLWAAASGLGLTTHAGAIESFDGRGADAILVHSFLVFIPPEDRPALFAAWARILRIGGRVLMSQRLVPPGGTYRRLRPPEEIRARRDSLAAALDRHCPVSADRAEILDAAERLWVNALGGNGTWAEDIRSLAHGAGFEVTDIAEDASRTSGSPFAAKSSALSRARAEIVLTRVR